MNIALQVSARHNPQVDKTSLDNSFWFLLELEFKPSQRLLKINVQFCVKEEGEDLVFNIEETVKKAVLEMLVGFFWRQASLYIVLVVGCFLFVQCWRCLVSHIPFSCASYKIKASQKLAPAGDIRTTT